MKIVKTIILVYYLFFSFQLVAQQRVMLDTVLDSIETIMEKRQIPGLLLSIVTKDSVLYDGGLGRANLEAAQAVNANSLFRMASITKTLAALAMVQLEAAGHFDLMDNLKNVAPEIAFNNKWSATHPLKIIHILEHTAGFDDFHPKAAFNNKKQELSVSEMVALHKESYTARWQPGTRHAYSNSGYVILTYLIEKFSNQSYHDYIQQNIFTTIGMSQSNTLAIIPENAPQYAKGYLKKSKEFIPVPFVAVHTGLATNFNTSGTDMAKFIQLFLNDGVINNQVVLPAGAVQKMETASTSLAAKKGRQMGNYALGLAPGYMSRGFPFYGHAGSITGFNSMFRYNKDLGIGFGFVANSNQNIHEISQLIIDLLIQDVPKPAKKTADLAIDFIKPYLGYYQLKSPRYQLIYPLKEYFEGLELKLINDKLYTVDMWGKKRRLIPTDTNLFRPSWTKYATSILTENESGKKVFIASNYYEKESSIGIWMKRVWYGCSLFISGTFSFFALFWLILNYFRKDASPATRSVASFFTSFLGFALGGFSLYLLSENMMKFGGFNWMTGLYFISSLVCGISAVVGTCCLWKDFSSIQNKILKYYLILVAFSFLGLSVYFTYHGIIGLRLWSY